ncbi:MAG: DUF1559 domain-containing protein [Fimbriimonas ginsengisoli]|uniref:DUF1559 domain-containing protein n=1 Tax=Fimbriimonas ginsengisoli TaxID=1005039 RepID=A0A931PVK9_FIMGI|nr:DUF1559 domain-containing protein [Fimbriimonas ginsengisoli]
MAAEFDDALPEEGKRTHMTLKEVRAVLIVIGLFILLMIPLYKKFREDRDRHLCKANFKQIGQAMFQYAEGHDDRFPTAFETTSSGAPQLDGRGRPYTWATLIAPYMNARSNFSCPASTEEETVLAQHPASTASDLPMSYGMYGAYAGFPVSHVSNPDRVVLVAETSNFGSMHTFDPTPFLDDGGKPVPADGFLIGYSDGNGAPTLHSGAVTRLAFYGTQDGNFDVTASSTGGWFSCSKPQVEPIVPRHSDGIFFLDASGGIKTARPSDALITRQANGEVAGSWSVPARTTR